MISLRQVAGSVRWVLRASVVRGSSPSKSFVDDQKEGFGRGGEMSFENAPDGHVSTRLDLKSCRFVERNDVGNVGRLASARIRCKEFRIHRVLS